MFENKKWWRTCHHTFLLDKNQISLISMLIFALISQSVHGMEEALSVTVTANKVPFFECGREELELGPEWLGETKLVTEESHVAHVARYPMTSAFCSSDFSYCSAGEALPGSCPEGLFYNPMKSDCDVKDNIESCLLEADKHEARRIRSSSRYYRPIKDDPSYNDCSRRACNFYPDGDTEKIDGSTYIFCLDGHPEVRDCPEGTLFDMHNNDCVDSASAKIWSPPPKLDGQKLAGNPLLELDEAGGKALSLAIDKRMEALEPHKSDKFSPIVIDEDTGISVIAGLGADHPGHWSDWMICPNATFVTAMGVGEQTSPDLKQGLLCTNPADLITLEETLFSLEIPEDIRKIWKNLPDLNCADGSVVVGFKVAKGEKAKFICSNEAVDDAPSGDGSAALYEVCPLKTAACGVSIKATDQETTNIRLRCCPIPGPLNTDTIPEEDLIEVITCDNLESGDDPRWKKCEFETVLGGITVIREMKSVHTFYVTAGFEAEKMWRIVKKKLKKWVKCKTEPCIHDAWDKFDLDGPEPLKVTKKVLVPPKTKLKLLQVYAKLDFVRVYTTKFLEVIEDKETGTQFEELRAIPDSDLDPPRPKITLMDEEFSLALKGENISFAEAANNPLDICMFHALPSAKVYEEEEGERNPFFIRSPEVTNWGEWGNWDNCSDVESNWGYVSKVRVMQKDLDNGNGKIDRAGAVQLALRCQTLDRSRLRFEQKAGRNLDIDLEALDEGEFGIGINTLELVNPGLKAIPWRKKNTWQDCKEGFAVGFEVYSVPNIGKDNVATENVRLICSCTRKRTFEVGLKRKKDKKKKQAVIAGTEKPIVEETTDETSVEAGVTADPSLNLGFVDLSGNVYSAEGSWTEKQVCRPEQALSAIQPQFHLFKDKPGPNHDNTGLNNIKMKCEDVPTPAQFCDPVQEKIHIARCSNKEGDKARSCAFIALEGVTYNLTKEDMLPIINVMESVGHTLPCQIPVLKEDFKKLDPLRHWMEPEHQQYWHGIGDVTVKISQVAPKTAVDLWQYIGVCGPYVIHTNIFEKTVSPEENDKKPQKFELPPVYIDNTNYEQCWRDSMPVPMKPAVKGKPDTGDDSTAIAGEQYNLDNIPPYHEKYAGNDFTEVADGIILSSPEVTDFGDWIESEGEGGWNLCPSGSYVNSMNVKRYKEANDDFGVSQVKFRCIFPGNETQSAELALKTPGMPEGASHPKRVGGWVNCSNHGGVAIGFQLNSQPTQLIEADDGTSVMGDNVATDNVLLSCSVGANAVNRFHDEDESLRGTWTEKQHCLPKQAICGFKGQFRPYEAPSTDATKKEDNTGLDNVKAKCCNVLHPAKTCIPTEKKILVGTCDNQIKKDRPCALQLNVGIDYDPNLTKEEKLLRNFYESIGYTKNCAGKVLSEQYKNGPGVKCEVEGGCNSKWSEINAEVWKGARLVIENFDMPKKGKKEIYQIVGKCGYFTIYTPEYVIDDKPHTLLLEEEPGSVSADELCWEDNAALRAQLPAGGRIINNPNRIRFKRQNRGFNPEYTFVDEGTVMESPVMDTDFPDSSKIGAWQTCNEPENDNSWYVDSIFVERQGISSPFEDLTGLVAVGFHCRNMKMNGEGDHVIVSTAEGAAVMDEGMWDWKRCSCGAGVGFQVSSVPAQQLGDDLAIESMKLECSCSDTVWKTKDDFPSHLSGLRGNWTEVQSCRPRQALCGLQTKSTPFMAPNEADAPVMVYDNAGITRVKTMCCNVPNPTIMCEPKEVAREIGICDNTEGSTRKKCKVDTVIGVAVDQGNKDFVSEVKFYESIGWNLDCTMDELEDNLSENLDDESNYKWSTPHPMIYQHAVDIHDVIKVNPLTKTTILQIVGECGPYVVATNRFIRRDVSVIKGEGYVNEDYYGFQMKGGSGNAAHSHVPSCWADGSTFPARDFIRPTNDTDDFIVPFHGYPAATTFTISTLSQGGIEIESHTLLPPIHKVLPTVGDDDDDQDSHHVNSRKEFCGADKYITGFATDSIIMNGTEGESDVLGMTHLMVECRTLDRLTEKNEVVIEHPEVPLDMERLKSYYQECLQGVLVGFQVSFNPFESRKTDNIGIDNIRGICSVGKPLDYPRKQMFNFTDKLVVCRPHQALCSMTAVFGPQSVGSWQKVDGTGIARLKMECCNVPNPAKVHDDIPPVEALRLVTTCDNIQYTETRKCEFALHLGITYDMEEKEEESAAHMSIGYCVPCIMNQLKKTFYDHRKEIICEKPEEDCDFNWGDATETTVFQGGLTSYLNSTRIKSEMRLEIHQVVGKLNDLLVLTNNFLYVWLDKEGNKIFDEKFIIDLDNFPALNLDEVQASWDIAADEIARDSDSIRGDNDNGLDIDDKDVPPLQIWNATDDYEELDNKTILSLIIDQEFVLAVSESPQEWLDWVNCTKGMFVSHLAPIAGNIAEVGNGFNFKCGSPIGGRVEQRKVSTVIKHGDPNEMIVLKEEDKQKLEDLVENPADLNVDGSPGVEGDAPEATEKKDAKSGDDSGCPCRRAIGLQAIFNEVSAVIGMSLICSCGSGLVTTTSTRKQETNGQETTIEHVYCKDRTALCGFQIQNQNNKIKGIRAACCNIPSPAKECTPIEKLHRVAYCDNSHNQITRPCLFDLFVGLSYDNKHYKPISSFYEMTSWSLDCMSKGLSETFSKDIGPSKATSYNWEASANQKPQGQEWDKLQRNSYNLTVESMKKLEIFQIIGQCGIYVVYTDQFLITETSSNLGRIDNFKRVINFGSQIGDEVNPNVLQRNPGVCWMDNVPIVGQSIIVHQNDVGAGLAPFHKYVGTEVGVPIYKLDEETARTALQIQAKPEGDGDWPADGKVLCADKSYIRKFGVVNSADGVVVAINFKCTTINNGEGKEFTIKLPSHTGDSPAEKYNEATFGAYVSILPKWKSEGELADVILLESTGQPADDIVDLPKQSCHPGQALCGLQVQWGDNGAKNLRGFCCLIETPVLSCIPREETRLAAVCDNTRDNRRRECDVKFGIGVTYNFHQHAMSSAFHSSIGHSPNCMIGNMRQKFQEMNCTDGACQFNWGGASSEIWYDGQVIPETTEVDGYQKVEYMQHIGVCSFEFGEILVLTNVIKRVALDQSDEEVKSGQFILMDIPAKEEPQCEFSFMDLSVEPTTEPPVAPIIADLINIPTEAQGLQCPFHGIPQSSTFEYGATEAGSVHPKIILTGPVDEDIRANMKTKWGEWQNCTPNSYSNQLETYTAVVSDEASGRLVDSFGVHVIMLRCGDAKEDNLAQLRVTSVPDAETPAKRVYKPCSNGSVAVGFEAQIRKYQGPTMDDNAYVNFKQLCSCGLPAVVDFSDIAETDLLIGDWESPQVCRPREAICGYVAEHSEYLASENVGWYDNVGISGLNAKCCPVPSPALSCEPSEEKVLAAKCENPDGEGDRKCEFEAYIGLGYHTNEQQKERPSFYESVGWNLECVKEELSAKFGTKLGASKVAPELDWAANVVPTLKADENFADRTNTDSKIWLRMAKRKVSVDLKTGDSISVYQVMGKCGMYAVYTNAFVRKDEKSSEEKVLVMPKLGNTFPEPCWVDAAVLNARNWLVDWKGMKTSSWSFPLHSHVPSTGKLQMFNAKDGSNRKGIIAQTPNPPKSVYKWHTSHTCPVGSYVRSISVNKVVMEDKKLDVVGAVSIGYHCMAPNGTILEEKLHVHQSWKAQVATWRRENFGDPGTRYQICQGAGIGIEVEASPLSTDDDYGILDIRLLCGYGKDTDFTQKPKEATQLKPDISRDLVCKPRQAICHAQPSFGKPPVKKKDNVGLTNMRWACCDVPSPLTGAEPREDLLLAATCDNLVYNRGRKCKYTVKVGVGYDLVNHESASYFYMSIGYTPTCMNTEVREKFSTLLGEVPPSIYQEAVKINKVVHLEPKTRVDIYQKVGIANEVQVLLNKFVVVTFDENNGEIGRKEIVEDKLPRPVDKECEVNPDSTDFQRSLPPAIPSPNLDPPKQPANVCKFKERLDSAIYMLSSDGSNFIEGTRNLDIETNHKTTWEGYEWKNCTQGDVFISGFKYLKGQTSVSGEADSKEADKIGVEALAMQCKNVKEGKSDQILTAQIKGSKAEVAKLDESSLTKDGHICKMGVGIGFKLGVKPFQKLDDDTAVEDLRMQCSCGDNNPQESNKKAKKQKTKKNKLEKVDEDKWTETKYCRPREALCGFTIQAQEIVAGKSIRVHDNIGISNVRMKCCSVPSPAKECAAKEKVVLVGKCDNIGGLSLKRCSIPLHVGYTYSYEREDLTRIETHESVGWTLGCVAPELAKKFGDEVKDTQNFNWTKATTVISTQSSYWTEMNKKIKIFAADEKTEVEVQQIIGLCGIYKIYTPRFIVTVKGVAGEILKQEVLNYDDISSKTEHHCWEKVSPIKGRDWAVTSNSPVGICPDRSSFPAPSKQETLDPLTDSLVGDPTKSGFIIQTPNPDSPYHKWGEWKLCPTGTYVRGWTNVASGKGIQDDPTKDDYSGVVMIKAICQAPDNNQENQASVMALQPNNEWEEGKWTSEGRYGMLNCLGAGIGIQAKIHANPKQQEDRFYIHDTKLICSCGEDAGYVRGDKHATEKKQLGRDILAQEHKAEVCKSKHAICGLKASWGTGNIGDHKKQDGYGASNIRILCCKVPSPVTKCEKVTERLVFASACDNSKGSVSRKCMHNLAVGVAYNFDLKHEAESYFYSSNGFTPSCVASELKEKFTASPPEPCAEAECKADWAGAPAQVWQEAVSIPHSEDVEPHQRYRVYQVVGECNSLIVYTNQFVKVIADEAGNEISRTKWVSTDLPPPKVTRCED